jgi:hypothetical protein
MIAFLFSACHRDPNVAQAEILQKRAGLAFAPGKYREAAIQFQNATQIDPHFS